jgi:hypothetical protein
MIGATLFLLFMTADVTGQVKPPDGCQPIRLRQTGAQCYAAEVDGVAYRVRLSIWDDARPASPAVFCLPARYGRAEVRAERWGPAGTDVLVARIVGDSGTAALQTVGVGIGWVGSGYGLVLFETLDYTLGGRRLTGRMAHAGGRLVLSYDYTDAPYMEPDRPTLKDRWQLSLVWNDRTMRYDGAALGPGSSPLAAGVAARAEAARRAAFALTLPAACDPAEALTRDTGVMDIMPPASRK